MVTITWKMSFADAAVVKRALLAYNDLLRTDIKSMTDGKKKAARLEEQNRLVDIIDEVIEKES